MPLRGVATRRMPLRGAAFDARGTPLRGVAFDARRMSLWGVGFDARRMPLRGVGLGKRSSGALAWVDAPRGRWLGCPAGVAPERRLGCPAHALAGRCAVRPADHAKMWGNPRRPSAATEHGASGAVMLSEAKHPACLRQSAGFFVAALLRMTGGATAAARYTRARRAACQARSAQGAPHARRAARRDAPRNARRTPGALRAGTPRAMHVAR